MTMAWRAQFQRISQEGAAPNLQPQRKRVQSACVYGGGGLFMEADAMLMAF